MTTTDEKTTKPESSDVVRFLLIALLVLMMGGAYLAGSLVTQQQIGSRLDAVETSLKDEIDVIKQIDQAEADRDKAHICHSGIDHLEQVVIVYDIARQAGLDVSRVRTRLRPEVRKICASINGEH